MKILFMGSPSHSANVLKTLIDNKIDVCAVVTNHDKPKGRGREVSQSAVAKVANEHDIKTYKPEKVKYNIALLEDIRKLSVDLVIVVAYGKILPKEFLEIPKYGCINLHTSLLPKYRGASPIQSSLLNGDKETGVTIMKIEEALDSGEIIFQEKMSIDEDDNSLTLFNKLFIAGEALLLKVIGQYKIGNVEMKPQKNEDATFCRTIKKEDGLIDFNESSELITNKIRAYYSWPGAYCFFKSKKIKFLKSVSKMNSKEFALAQNGTVVHLENSIHIKTENGILIVKELHPENSKAMSADAFISGYRIQVGDVFTVQKPL